LNRPTAFRSSNGGNGRWAPYAPFTDTPDAGSDCPRCCARWPTFQIPTPANSLACRGLQSCVSIAEIIRVLRVVSAAGAGVIDKLAALVIRTQLLNRRHRVAGSVPAEQPAREDIQHAARCSPRHRCRTWPRPDLLLTARAQLWSRGHLESVGRIGMRRNAGSGLRVSWPADRS